MRFFLAFFIILAANSPQGVGMGLLLCLWKIADLVYDLKPKKANKPDTANTQAEGRGTRTLPRLVGGPNHD